MKVKLDAIGAIKVLSILEDLPLAQIPIIRAGIQKILQSGADKLILDLSAIASAPDDAWKNVRLLQALAPPGKIIIVAKKAEVADFSDLDSALGHARGAGAPPPEAPAAATAPAASGGAPQSEEAQLTAQKNSLTSRKKVLEAQITAANAKGDIKAMRQENTNLKKSIRYLESLIKSLMQERKAEPFVAEAIGQKMTNLESVVTPVLVEKKLVRA